MEQDKTEEHVSECCECTKKVACANESLDCGVRKHEKEDRENHLDLYLAFARSLSKQNKKLLRQCKELPYIVYLCEEQHRILSKQHKTRSAEEQHRTRRLSVGEEIVFKLSGYANKKENDDAYYSPTFYTHQGGYKMCILIYPNGYGDGEGEGTHVSVFTKLLEGRYDNNLHWPFLGTVTYELLNQLGDDNHHRMVRTFTTRDNTSVSCIESYSKFIPHSSLGHNSATNTQYLLDDTLYFRVSVKVDNHKPWLVCTLH